ncbi:hypothetical protein N6L24_00540 [Cognatishimia sp. SS12]|uniref:hypothetical protein n=1 Tax=Cognatishimia sp. SS12 TaxID=2979465 RepID=UPI00232D0FB8|nr:hypothetical protein [Cognatishimia sp. SS12]MDC0736753.1 hypothetical protein [Cognatishimia sp. SS12]
MLEAIEDCELISVDWDAVFSWPGYDFWGILLAMVGFAFSIAFAARASSKASVAANAAHAAKRSMINADTASQITLVQQMLVEIRLRVENQQWEQVSEKCEAIRVIVAPLLSSGNVELSEETEKSLIGLQAQMASLQKSSDEIRHNGSDFNLVKIKSVLAKQAEAVAKAVREIKDNTEAVQNV